MPASSVNFSGARLVNCHLTNACPKCGLMIPAKKLRHASYWISFAMSRSDAGVVLAVSRWWAALSSAGVAER